MRPQQDIRAGTDKWPTYQLFGLALGSDFPFAGRLTPSTEVPDLTFTCVMHAPFCSNLAALRPAYTSPYHNPDGKSNLALYRQSDCAVLCFTGIADFYLWPRRIVCHLSDSACVDLVEGLLLGVVLAF